MTLCDKNVHLVVYICVVCTYIAIIIAYTLSSPPLSFCHSFPPDTSITIRKVYQVTSAVRYGVLNECLEVPNSVFFQIDANPAYPTKEKKREALIAYFLCSLQNASWEILAGLLYYKEHHSALEAAREYLQHTTG